MLENLSWKAAVLGCVCAYVVTSKILFEHPEYLHESAKKRHQHHNYRMSDRHSFHISTIDASAKFHYQLVAHRGSRLEGLPENTIAAFRDASSGGASIVELDVWLSKDGKVVVHHDESLDRMTKGENKSFVHELQHEDFPKLVPGENQCERCHLFDDHECHRVPLLRDVIHQIPTSVAIVIEFKQNSYELIKKVHDIILDQGPKRVANVFWFSLQEPINKKLHDFDPTLSSITSITRMLLIFVYYYLGLLPFIPIQEDVFGITMEEVCFFIYIYILNDFSMLPLPFLSFCRSHLKEFVMKKPCRGCPLGSILGSIVYWLGNLRHFSAPQLCFGI